MFKPVSVHWYYEVTGKDTCVTEGRAKCVTIYPLVNYERTHHTKFTFGHGPYINIYIVLVRIISSIKQIYFFTSRGEETWSKSMCPLILLENSSRGNSSHLDWDSQQFNFSIGTIIGSLFFNKPLQGMAPTCILQNCITVCLFTWLLAWDVCLLTWLLAC